MKRRNCSLFPISLLIILIGLIHGIIYIFIIPPWQHYDEPGHFEYVWQIVHMSSWPKAGDYDPAMRRDMLVSMYDHGFLREANWKPDLTAAVPNIGYSQSGDPPVYFWLASLPIHFLQSKSLVIQLYASRLVSLILYLSTILIGWGVMVELTPPKHPLRWMVPLTLALLPGFTDFMTAVNSGVGAITFFSLFLWASVRSIRRGPSFLSLTLVLVAAALCFWTNNIVWISLPLLPVVLLFTFLRGRWRTLAWTLLLTSIGIGLLAVFSWGDAGLWYRHTFQNAPTRIANAQAPLGRYVFQLDISQDKSNLLIIQPLPQVTLGDLRNEPVTFGAWIWSSQQMQAEIQLSCDCGGLPQFFSREVQAGTEPRFYAFTLTIPSNARHISAVLTPPEKSEVTHGTLFYDGLILVKGERVTQDSPIFTDIDGKGGSWAGSPFTNLLRNSSAEQAGPGIQSWANKLIKKVLPPYPAFFPSDITDSMLDWKGAGWYYWATGSLVFRTFWAKFGWGSAPLLGYKPYRILAVVTLFGLAGAAWLVWRRRRGLSWAALFLLGLALSGVWIQTIVRGVGSLFGWTFIPAARNAYPVIIPTVLVLCAGWLEVLGILERWFRKVDKIQITIYLLFFAVLDALSIFSVLHYYY